VLPGAGGTVYFRYDPFGRRIYKSSPAGTNVYVYDGNNVIQELGGSGNPLASYTQGPGVDEPLAMYQGLTAAYFHADGLGSIASLTNPAGAVAASYVYDSFGNLTASTGTVTNPFQYTGREFDSETGLYYYRARYYDPTIGRFISEDPVSFFGGHNFYHYAGNEPTLFIDPSGLAKTCNLPPVGPNSKLPTRITKCASKDLIDCMIQTESSGNPNAVSPKAAIGEMQVTQAAVDELANRGLLQSGMSNLQEGTVYIDLLLSYCSNVTTSLAAYNAGYPTVNLAGGVPNIKETQNYVKRIDDCLKQAGLPGGVKDTGATCGCK
jgi:RHS repeat-associated protein